MSASRMIFKIRRTVPHADIERGTHLVRRVVLRAVHREREHARLLLEYRRRAVSLVDVQIDDGGASNRTLEQELSDRRKKFAPA